MATITWLKIASMTLLVLGAILLIVGGVLFSIYGQMKVDRINEVMFHFMGIHLRDVLQRITYLKNSQYVD